VHVEVGNAPVTSHLMLLILAGAFVVQALVSTLVAVLAVRKIIESNRELMVRFEALRTEALENYIKLQREENARLVRDTRAATAKMNVMADALWEGLRDTTRDTRD